MLNPSLHNPRIVDFKIGITPIVELEFITLSIIPPTDDFEIEFIDEGELSMTKQSVTGSLVIPEQPFLNLNLSINVSVTTSDGDHQTQSHDEELPPITWLKKLEEPFSINETLKLTIKADRVVQLSSLFSDYSIESSTFDVQNQIFFLVSPDQLISISSDRNELTIQSGTAASMVLFIKFLSNRLKKWNIIQSTKFENRIYSNFEGRMEHLSMLIEAENELKLKLRCQMKFLTALEKKLLVKVKLKNQLQESSIEYLIEQTLESISGHRRALVENENLKRKYELEAMASIQLIIITSFSRYAAIGKVLAMINNFNLEVINAPFMNKIELLLSFIGQRLGATVVSSNQVDVKRIKKRLHSILTRLSESAVSNVFSGQNKMNTVPLKPAEGDNQPAAPRKLAALPNPEQKTLLPDVPDINITPAEIPNVKPKRQVPEDFEQHMKMLQN